MFLALSGAPLVILSIIAFVLIIGLIVAIHEGGHFFFARRAGILCHEFSIGMGPVIYKKQFKETAFCIRAIPIGGFVSMAGEEVTSDLVKSGKTIGINLEGDLVSEIILDDKAECQIRGEVSDCDLYGENGEKLYITINTGVQTVYYEVKRNAFYVFEKGKRMQITPYDRSFESKSILQRFLTLFAGPFMNFVLAIFIYFIVSFATGVPNLDSGEIGSVSTYFPAEVAGLEAGDTIVGMNDSTGKYIEISSWEQFSTEADKLIENNIIEYTLKVDRDGVLRDVTIVPSVTIQSAGISNQPYILENGENIAMLEKPEGIKGARVGSLAVRWASDEGSLRAGDIITAVSILDYKSDELIETKTVEDWSDLVTIFDSISDRHIKFEYYHYNGDLTKLSNVSQLSDINNYSLVKANDCKIIEPYTNEVLENQRIEKIYTLIGISPVQHFSFFGCIGQAFSSFWDDFTLIFRTLKLLIAPSEVRQIGVSDLSGFVGIFSMIETFVSRGFIPLLAFAALLSVNIGVMNLLPIPALDGGRLAFLLYEAITRRKPSKKVEAIINNVFFILLMILFVYITIHDIMRLF